MQSSIKMEASEVERLLRQNGDKIERLFDGKLEDSAREQKALLRRREIQQAKDLLHLALVYALQDWSLNLLGVWAFLVGIGYLSDVALLKRLRNCADWLGTLLYQVLQQRCAGLGQDPGVRICLRDATVVNAPGSAGTDWRIHLKLDLGKGCISDVAVTDRKTGENLTTLAIQPGEIEVADRGYSLASGIGAVLEKFAHVVVRLNAQNLPLWLDAHTRLDLPGWLRQVTAPAEQPVCLKTPFGWFAMRVLAHPLDPQAAEEARRRVRASARKKKYQPSEASLLAAGFILLITDLAVEVWPMQRVFWLYRLRWQVELQFKSYKSLLQLDRLRAHNPQMARTYLLAKLLLVLLVEELTQEVRTQQPHWFSDPLRPVSVWRLTACLKEYLHQVLVGSLSFARLWSCLPALQRYFRLSPRSRLNQYAWAQAFLEHFSVSNAASFSC